MALPQPLRWFMGHWAKQMNRSLAGLLDDQRGRTMHWHPETTTTTGMAADGIHPSSEGYAAWADGLSLRILAARTPCAFESCHAPRVGERTMSIEGQRVMAFHITHTPAAVRV
jgi:hypothetical protein